MDPITLAMVGAGLGKVIWGAVQEHKAAELKKQNIRPQYDIPKEYYQNAGMYQNLAQEGLPENDLDRMHQEAMRGLSASLSAGLQAGAGPNSVNDYYQSYLDKMGDIGVRNAMQRFSNINQLASARDALANQEFIQFGYNKDAPFKDNAQLSTLEQQQGEQNIVGGVDTGLSGFIGGQARKLYQPAIATNQAALSVTPPVDGSARGAGSVSTSGNFDINSDVLNSWARTMGNNAASRAGSVNPITGAPLVPENGSDYYFNKLMNGNLWWLKK